MGLELRPISVQDVPAIMALERELFPEDAWSEGMLRAELAQPDRYYIVAQTDALGLIGYAGLRTVAPEGDVQTMAVAPEHWGRGIGRALLTELLAEARRRAITDIFLEVRSDNPRAQDLYRRFGFEEVGVRRGYYVGADAIVMRRLAPASERTAVEEER